VANCGGYKNSAEWAKKDSDGFIKALNKNKNAATLINKANPKILKEFMGALGRDVMHPFGWIGGEIVFSTMFSAAAESEGRTPLEALDEGVLWFLPKGVVDAHKKALFGFEGVGPAEAFKTKSYAGAYSQDQIKDMENYLDMEDSDRKYFAAKAQEGVEINRAAEIGGDPDRVSFKLKQIRDQIKKSGTASSDSLMDIYERNTGLRTDGAPRMEDMNLEQFQSFVAKTGDNLWDVQQQYAIDKVNQGKQAELNTLYAQKEDWLDKIVPGGERKDGQMQLPFGMGPARSVGTFITNPIDRFYSRSSVPHYEKLPPGIKQGWHKYIDAYNLLPHASQEEKERYAKEMGREDLLHKEYKHPIYGSSLSYDQMSGVYPDYFPSYNKGGRVPFGKGKLVDEGRRAFMKWLAGITGAGIAAGTGLIKWGVKKGTGETIVKAGDHIIQGTSGMPDWFIPLVNRITKEGTDVSKKLSTIERETVHTKKISPTEEVTVYQDMNTGNVRVEYGPPVMDKKGNIIRATNDQEVVHLEYRAGEVIDEGKHAGKKTNPEFSAAEAKPRVTNWEGDIEWEHMDIDKNVDDLLTDTSKLKTFAKKKLTHKDKVIAKKKQKYKTKLEKDPSEQLEYIEKKEGMTIDDIVDEEARVSGLADKQALSEDTKLMNLPERKVKKASGGRIDYDNYLPDIEDID
jgi:hypothetical protein